MKFLVGTVPTNLFQGMDTPSIGEERWGLNVVEVLLKRGHEVYTLPNCGVWRSDLPKPENYFPETLPSREAYYMGYWPGIEPVWKHHLLCRFDSFDHPVSIPPRTTIVHCYPDSTRMYDLRAKLGKAEFLPHVIDIHDEVQGTFDNLHIFWTSKNQFDCYSQDTRLPGQMIAWLSRQMSKDSRLTATFVSATHGKEWEQGQKDMQGSGLIRDYLSCFGDRVQILGYTDYGEMKRLLAKSKIILNAGNFNHTFGGSSLEAAAFGIPSVQFKEGPFNGCSDKIWVEGSRDLQGYTSSLDRLFHNQDEYRKYSHIYREYVRVVYSPEVFVRRLSEILGEPV